jgi:O-antigen/teichoic acid export membrane protein
MGPDSVTGLYSAAVRLIESLLVIPVTLSVVLFPVVSRIHRNSKMSFFSLYKISSVSSLAMGILVSFLLYASSGLFIRYIFGSGFLNSVYLAKILSFIFIPFFLKLFLERSALVLGKFDILLKAYIGGVILKIVLNLFFMRAMDYRGVALTSIFTEAAVALFVYCLLRRYFWERLILPENDASTNTWDLLHEKE